MLIDKIRDDMHNAKKSRETLKSNLLSTLYAEMFTQSKSGKPLTEDDCIRIIKKFLKNINDTLALDIPPSAKEKYSSEKIILEEYLPKQMSNEEIDVTVTKLICEGKVMKDIMAYFKENYAGRYDGKTVNEIIRSKTS